VCVYLDTCLPNNVRTIVKILLKLGINSMCLEASSRREKTEYCMCSHLVIRTQDKGQNIKIANKSFNYEAKFKYFDTIVTNQNYIHNDIEKAD
jgi:hypothetical protein